MPPQTPHTETLAQMVRAKYPGAYDDLSDADLEAAVRAKYPGIYDDLPTTGTQPVSPAPSEASMPAQSPRHPLSEFGTGILKGVASTAIGGAELVNKGLSTIGMADPIKPEVFHAARQEFASPDSSGQRLGFGMEQVGEFLAPFGVGAKAKAFGRVAGMVGEGAEFGAKSAVQSGGDPTSVVTASLLGASSPVIAGAMQKVGTTVGAYLPERLYKQVFNVAKEDWRAAAQSQAKGAPPDPTLAREVLDRGLRGNPMNMAVYALRKLDGLEQQVQTLVRRGMGPSGAPRSTGLSTITLPRKQDVINVLKTVEQGFKKSFFSDRAAEAKALSQRLRGVRGDQVRAVDALDVKRFLDKMRNTSSFRLDANLSAKQEELKGAADLVRRTLKQDARFATLMDEERIMIEAVDAIVETAVRNENRRLLNLTDVMLGGGGLATGFPGAGVGAMAAVRAFQQPFTLTNIGYWLDRLYKATPQASGAVKPVAAGLASGAAQR